jgi:hypothetical protein
MIRRIATSLSSPLSSLTDQLVVSTKQGGEWGGGALQDDH